MIPYMGPESETVNKSPEWIKAYVSLIERSIDYQEKYPPKRYSIQTLIAQAKLND